MSVAVVFDGKGCITKIRKQVERPDARVYFGDTNVVRAARITVNELEVCTLLEQLTTDAETSDDYDGRRFLPKLRVIANGPVLFVHMPMFSTVTVQSEVNRGKRLDVGLCQQLARGVAFLHQHNIVHGDIAPANVLLKLSSTGGQVQIIDFGSSTIFKPGTPFHPLPIQRTTATTRDAYGRFFGRSFPVSDVVSVVLLSLVMRGIPNMMVSSDHNGPDGVRHAINVALFGPLSNGWGLHNNCPYCPGHTRRSVLLPVLLRKCGLPETWADFCWTDLSVTAKVLCCQ